MIPARTIVFLLLCLIAISASAIAVQQRLLLQELRSSLSRCQQDEARLEARASRLENNLQSAGQQMDNLSRLIQEASQRAARCESTADPGD